MVCSLEIPSKMRKEVGLDRSVKNQENTQTCKIIWEPFLMLLSLSFSVCVMMFARKWDSGGNGTLLFYLTKAILSIYKRFVMERRVKVSDVIKMKRNW